MAACEKCWSEATMLAASSGRPVVAHYNQLLPVRQCHQVKPSRQVNPDDYAKIRRGGHSRRGHIWVAESALGKPLPKGAQVHHVDENKSNNDPSNLVICQDQAYHSLLHLRQRVLAMGGNPNTQRICCTCKQLKFAEELVGGTLDKGEGNGGRQCSACERAQRATRLAARLEGKRP